jgi:NADH-quinone oxidoreductase subunit J
MMLSALFFYLFATMCVGAGVMVIAAKNPVHAVLYLIFAFFNAAGLFVLLGAEFLAMILVPLRRGQPPGRQGQVHSGRDQRRGG